MKIIVNGIVETDAYPGATLGEIFEQVLRNKVFPGTYIRSLVLNGETVEFEDKTIVAAKLRAFPAKDIASFEIVIASLDDIVVKNIDNIEEYLTKLVPGIRRAAELFQLENEQEANKFFLNIIDGFDWISETLSGIMLGLRKDPATFMLGGQSVQDRQLRLIELTKQLLAANKNRDWVLMADLLEYELAPFYKEWQAVLPELRQALKESAN